MSASSHRDPTINSINWDKQRIPTKATHTCMKYDKGRCCHADKSSALLVRHFGVDPELVGGLWEVARHVRHVVYALGELKRSIIWRLKPAFMQTKSALIKLQCKKLKAILVSNHTNSSHLFIDQARFIELLLLY